MKKFLQQLLSAPLAKFAERTARVPTFTQYRAIIMLSFLLVYTQSAHAYLDPGTGSMLLAVIIGIVSTLLFTLRMLWYKLLTVLSPSAATAKKAQLENKKFQTIVCYSEGAQYWSSFKTLLEALHERKIHASYLTSGEHDKGLEFNSEYIHTKYIGKGNKCYAYLNLLQAKVCVLTTPNLDALQIRRSKGVAHYTHILHASTDIHLYKLFAFDFYDSVMLSGPHQKKSIRHLETLRGTQKKQLFDVGCPYMDVLMEKKQQHLTRQGSSTTAEDDMPKKSSVAKTILLAPTWGESGLLYIAGEKILTLLASLSEEKNYEIIVRPHPQSLAVEQDMIQDLRALSAQFSRISWDTSSDNFSSMLQADLLISERSGIIFDFAFVFKKPVLTFSTAPVLKGMEGNDIPWDAWELEILPQIGMTMHAQNLDAIDELVENTIAEGKKYTQNILDLQSRYLYSPCTADNLGAAGKAAADAIVSILDSIENA